MEKTAYLILENGKVFKGKSFGAQGAVTGEVVFTTAMTGYLETLTDPSYYGQIVVQTFPLIGNYGVIPEDFESKGPALKGYIVREVCEHPSNFRCDGKLSEFLESRGIIGLYGIDTRQLTRIIREHGVMNGRITTDPNEADMEEIRSYLVKDAVDSVSTGEKYVLSPEGEIKKKVVLWDFGAKMNIERELVKRGCEVTVVPGRTTAEEILALSPEGIMLSNGPGDPAENVGIIAELKKVADSKTPIFGICLGHQLLALAEGGKTVKLKYGHRGANQPVKNLATDRIFVSSQNHGYAVDTAQLPENAVMSYENANDGTCEGLRYLDIPAYNVQFHPEACGDPHDTNFLFDEFIALMDKNKA